MFDWLKYNIILHLICKHTIDVVNCTQYWTNTKLSKIIQGKPLGNKLLSNQTQSRDMTAYHFMLSLTMYSYFPLTKRALHGVTYWEYVSVYGAIYFILYVPLLQIF